MGVALTRLRFAARMLRRDLMAGEITLLAIALVVAVAAMTSVGFFTDRVQAVLEREANQLLGGDVLLSADAPLPQAYADEADALGMRHNRSFSFTSMASSASGTQLVGVKAVEESYPLRGALRIAPGLNQPDAPTRAVPARGEAWVDERLASALALNVGDTLTLGRIKLRVGAVLTYEPDRGVNFFAIVPRLMIHAADLPATGLIQEGSRVNYRLHVAGEPRAVEAWQGWIKPRLTRGQRIEDVSSARPELRTALDRAQRFLKLSALLAVVLAAVAIGLSARRFMERHLNGCAVMRCLGASSRQLALLLFLEFLILGTIAAAMGALIGFAVQGVLAQLLTALVDTALPAPSVLPLAHGFAVAIALLIGFLAPHVIRLARVPPIAVMRREWATARTRTALVWLVGFLVLAALMLWIAGEATLGLTVVGGFAAGFVVFALLAWGALRLVTSVRHWLPAGARFGLSSVRARLPLSVVQCVALGLGLMAVISLSATRSDLLRNWANSVPPDAPNRFIINIQPDQRDAVRAMLEGQGIAVNLNPMVRGRLIAVNERAVSAADYQEDRAQRLIEREFNLSWDTELPYGNKVVAGQWHGDVRGAPQFSVEAGLAKTLGLKLGDTLRFDIAGRTVDARITSLRALRWDSMRVNFFVIAPPDTLQDQPASFITAFHLPPDKTRLPDELVARFPNLTVIDVSAVLTQFKQVMDQLARAVEAVFVFSIVAGVAVLLSALAATHDERRYELSILRTLGAGGSRVRSALIAEFLVLGCVAGLLGAAGAGVIGWVLAEFIFKLPYDPAIVPLAGAVLMSAAGVLLAGFVGTREARSAPVIEGLRGQT